jgi:hypothetical protein
VTRALVVYEPVFGRLDHAARTEMGKLGATVVSPAQHLFVADALIASGPLPV